MGAVGRGLWSCAQGCSARELNLNSPAGSQELQWHRRTHFSFCPWWSVASLPALTHSSVSYQTPAAYETPAYEAPAYETPAYQAPASSFQIPLHQENRPP